MSPAVHEDDLSRNGYLPYQIVSDFDDSKCVGKLRFLAPQRISNHQHLIPSDMEDDHCEIHNPHGPLGLWTALGSSRNSAGRTDIG